MQLRRETTVLYCMRGSILCLLLAGMIVSSCLKRAEVLTRQPFDLEKYSGVYALDVNNGPFAKLYVKDGKLFAEYEENSITFVHTEGHKFRMDGGPLDAGIAEFIPDGEGSFSSCNAEG